VKPRVPRGKYFELVPDSTLCRLDSPDLRQETRVAMKTVYHKLEGYPVKLRVPRGKYFELVPDSTLGNGRIERAFVAESGVISILACKLRR
jgi:hypothetical protein